MTTDDPVLTSLDGGILTVTINRPRRKNAIDAATWIGLRDAFGLAGGSDVRVLVLTGAGGDFSAGADLSAGRGEDHPLRRMHEINDVALLLHELSVPTIAKISGVAVGAGWNMALGCDLVVAATTARFSQIFAKRGLSLDFGGSWLLPKIVGLQQAKRLALLAEIIDAPEAERLGLVTYLVEPEELDKFVDDLAQRLAVAPPVAVAQSKALLNENADRTLRDALASEARAQSVNFATEDTRIAFRAFLDKTDAEYTGSWAVD
ncbi:enoyl-CoA hydratase/isomerase family protein [Pseudonocardia spinosispora]|uniref:enoyl-CoA hydratase/isomerase family protein n=1 Tax=Pseudonocardia spinosispora TaxID=103441 RepID=UPI00040472E7|nr:enoyl-CoA hydratase-related protein [Pseudonocardia spinosispora]